MLNFKFRYFVFIMIGTFFLAHADDMPEPFTQEEQKAFLDKIYAQNLPLGLGGFMAEFVRNYGTDKEEIIIAGILDLNDDQIMKIYNVAQSIGLESLASAIQDGKPRLFRDPQEILFESITNANADLARQAFAKGAKVTEEVLWALFNAAVAKTNVDYIPILELFFAHGAKIKVDEDSQYLFNLAINRKNKALVEFLMQHGFSKDDVEEKKKKAFENLLQ